MIARALVLSPNRAYAHEFRNEFQQRVAAGCHIDVETDPMRAMSLSAGGYELIVMDGELGPIDGIQLMLMLKGHAPGAIFAIVYDTVNDLVRMQALQMGARLVLSRPVDAAGWEALMNPLAEVLEPRAAAAVEDGADDGEEAVPVREILSTECLSGKSTYIQVARPDGGIGDIFVYQGDLYHAQCPGGSGEKAVAEILSWPPGGLKVSTRELAHIPPRTIDTPWREVLDMPAEPAEPAVVESPAEMNRPNEMASEAPAFQTGELPEPVPPADLPSSGLPAVHLTRTGSLIEPGEAFESPSVQSYWNIDLAGTMLGGKNVEDPEDAARLTYHIYRFMAEASVALEIDYFDRLTLYGPQVQQELAADNLGVSHAIFDTANATQDERDAFVKWCYGKNV